MYGRHTDVVRSLPNALTPTVAVELRAYGRRMRMHEDGIYSGFPTSEGEPTWGAWKAAIDDGWRDVHGYSYPWPDQPVDRTRYPYVRA